MANDTTGWTIQIANLSGVVKTYTQDDLEAFLAEVPNAVGILSEIGVTLK